MLLIFLDPIIGYYLKRWSSIPWEWASESACPRLSNWDSTVKCQARQAVLFCQSERANPALKQHEWPVFMLIFHQQIGVHLIQINLFSGLLLTIVAIIAYYCLLIFLQVSGLLFAFIALGPKTSLLRLIDSYYCD